MDEELNDLHHLSSVVFTNIGGITPNIKNLIANAKAFHRSYQGTVSLGTQFVQSLDFFAQSALEAKGATHSVGETLNDIINIFCEIEAMKGDLMNIFMNEVIVPLDSRAEQEVNMSKLAYKQYLQDNKVQTEVVGKLTQEIVKLRKKSQKKKGKAGKYEKKEEELLEEFQNEEKKLRGLRKQGLRRALIGERRIYCFVADRICGFGRGMAVHSNRIATMINDRIDVWNKVVSNPSELPSESENVVQNPSVHYTATMRRKKQNTSPGKSNTLDSRAGTNRPSVIGKESFEPIPENGTDPDENANQDVINDEEGKTTVESNGIEQHNDADNMNVKVANGNARYSMISDTFNLNDAVMIDKATPQLRAMYSHAGKDNSQLSFEKGDFLFKLSDPTGGWQYGKHQKSERAGWFPAAYVEEIDTSSIPSPVIPTLHGSLIKKNPPPPPKDGPVRRFSTPATSSSPYIPAPDYDGLHDGSTELHQSVSAPRLSSSPGQKLNVNFADAPPQIIPPPAFADLSSSDPSTNTSVETNGGDFVAMPFPPPPPSLDIDEQEDEQDNPFAGVKLNKTVTNDRSMPNIAQ